ncbi:Uncharacterised protein [Halioglobus japonicus]|nr:Uncharacterised protein [Halioglobus japonicus]
MSEPYAIARWTGMYDNAIVGSLITSDDEIMQTGKIPQDVLH